MNLLYVRNRLFEGEPSTFGDCCASSAKYLSQISQRSLLSSSAYHTSTTNSRKSAPPSPSKQTARSRSQIKSAQRIPRAGTSPPPPILRELSSSPTTKTSSPAPPAAVLPTNTSAAVHDEKAIDVGADAINTAAMADKELSNLLQQLHQSLSSHNYSAANSLLSRAKVALLHLNALVPTPSTPTSHLLAARETLELGALTSIRLQDPDSFTRYFQQLQPFYALPESQLPQDRGNASKITGLYLLLLLSQGDYAGFHTLLESLEVAAAEGGPESSQSKVNGSKNSLEDDVFIQYPIRLEQALMEGSYDRVWGETKSESVPSEEFGIFSEVLVGTIRLEIASCSEKAYPSIPIANAKSLLFLDSEGAVVDFARSRGWSARDGRIYFPAANQQQPPHAQQPWDPSSGGSPSSTVQFDPDVLIPSGQVIENTLGYARELETIV